MLLLYPCLELPGTFTLRRGDETVLGSPDAVSRRAHCLHSLIPINTLPTKDRMPGQHPVDIDSAKTGCFQPL